ncbi:MAG: glutamine amidotransferase [Clostridiales bacterium]|nr:glutamine amidotransferase [Clostridiales bacterium]
MKINIAHLYPDLLNLYGDSGNILCLKNRILSRGIECCVTKLNSKKDFIFDNYDIIFIGGGQDFEQSLVLSDLSAGKIYSLNDAVQNGAVVLAVCGGFQLLGRYYETYSGERMEFTGILDFFTVGKNKRLIGNYEFKTEEKIRIIGFENHSGRTFLGSGVKPLGKVIKGYGNNGKDKTEGAKYKNTFCTYCHGPVLPKNPDFADLLIKTALERKYGSTQLSPLDSSVEILARKQIRDLYI